MKNTLSFIILFLMAMVSQAQVTASNIKIDSLPESEINIPIRINLKPVFALAERNVDTLFTSPGYPDGWIQADCATRYKYRFRRSPLRMNMNGQLLNLSFMGYYQITGSTRACLNGNVISPWTPGCRCGIDEPERRVNVGFSAFFQLRRDHILKTKIIRNEPKPLDKCEVCFWGQDITKEIMKGLKEELDLSKKAMEDSFSTYDLKPLMQQAWNLLSAVHTLPNTGYFSLNPKKLRMDNINAKNDMLNINIGITASPVVSFSKPEVIPSSVPYLESVKNPGGFNIYLEAALQYDSLSKVMNGYLAGKEFDLGEGIFKRHAVIKEASVEGDEEGNLLVKVNFTGSFEGTVYFSGKPVYDHEKRTIEVHELDYDLKTRNLLLKTAKWLFNKKIVSELQNYTSFEMGPYFDTASLALNQWMNREWTRGISGSGSVKELKLTSVHALPQHLLVRSNCSGNLSITVSEIDFVGR